MSHQNAVFPIVASLQAAVRRSLESLSLPTPENIHLEHPADPTHGDFATNTALQLFGQRGKEGYEALQHFSNPRMLGQAIADAITAHQAETPEIESVSIAGPGFINFTLTENYWNTQLARLLQDTHLPLLNLGDGQTVVVEFSSPNIAKPFTVGHLRSTIIGAAVANVLEASGFDVKRDNHLGDWGTQFGKLIYAIKAWSSVEEITQHERPVKKLVELYVQFHQEAEAHPELEDEGRAWFTRLEQGNEEARALWQQCIEWSWIEFNAIYAQLGVTFTENGGRGYGESHFENKMDEVIAELRAKNLLTESDGAQLVFFPGDEFPPLMILKKDGSTLYATRDLATDKFRLNTYGPDVTIINEVGAEQGLYFQQLFRTEELLGWVQPGQRVHVGHGHFRFAKGKMSTRKGNVIWLEDVLQEATQRAQSLAESSEKSDRQLAQKNAAAIGTGALKWNDLKRSPHLDVVFDWDELLNMQGNSGPYMQYTAVRARSVLQKANIDLGELPALTQNLTNPTWSEGEQALLKTLVQYPEYVASAAQEYAPHHLCTYLYNLAQTFNTFYNTHPIVGSAEQAQRLALTAATLRVVQHGLEMLGMETVEKM